MTDHPHEPRGRKGNQGNLAIREMEIGDLAAVYALGEALFTAERWPTLYRTWDPYELAVHFASDSEMCLVAAIDDKVAGFAVGTMLEKHGSAWTYGHLLWLGVDPTAGRKGIGSRLTAHLQEVFIELGARMILVDTDAENTPAIDFFKRAGFDDDSEHVYLSKNLTYDPQYIAHHRTGRVADRPGGEPVARKRAAQLRADRRQAQHAQHGPHHHDKPE
jgi:ribosomal protein S18 acetylase RimI-like enzyme